LILSDLLFRYSFDLIGYQSLDYSERRLKIEFKNPFILSVLLILSLLSFPRFFPATASTEKSPEGSDLYTANVLANGTVLVFKNSEQIAEIIPEVFTQGPQAWNYCPFEVWGKDSRFNGMADLPDQKKVRLSSSVTLSQSSIHIRYSMIPLQDVQVVKVRAGLFTPYQDWVGAPFHWGDRTGTILDERKGDAILAGADTETDSLGPAPKSGLILQWTAQGLHASLQDYRQWNPNLALTWDHHEPSDKPWLWKAGEEKDFDFTLALNRTITPLAEEGEKASSRFAGYWCGTSENEKNEKYRVAMRVAKNHRGQWDIHYSLLEEGYFNIEVSEKVTAVGSELRALSAKGNRLDLRLDSSGQFLDGNNKNGNKTFPVHLKRGLDFLLPRVDKAGNAVTEYGYQQPQTLSDGWAVGDLNQSPMDAKIVEKGITQILNQAFPHMQSVVLVQGSKLLLDEYFDGFGPGDEHQLRSVTKSVLSTLFGIASDRGLVNSGQKLYDYFPEYRGKPGWSDDKNKITLGMVLSQCAGFACDDYVPPEQSCLAAMYKSGDWLSYALSEELNRAPGTHYQYCNYCMIPLGAILARQTGMSVPDFAQKALYDPLGIQAHRWTSDPEGNAEVEGSHWLRPRDMAKLGYLYLRKGKWNGKQVLSENWVREATSIQAPRDGEKRHDYGYLWWEEQMPAGNRTVQVFYADGRGGQYIFVVPELDLVCALTAGNYGNRLLSKLPREFFKAYVLGAFP
jgi:CubicO group peptidase (beta-lactamase class C family)